MARQKKWVLRADRLQIILTETGDDILHMDATGEVRVVTRDCGWATARRAEYHGPRRVIHRSRRRASYLRWLPAKAAATPRPMYMEPETQRSLARKRGLARSQRAAVPAPSA